MPQQEFHIILTGQPVSVNSMWRSSLTKNGKPYTYMPTEAKNMKEFWQLETRKQWQKTAPSGGHIMPLGADNLDVDIKFFFKDRLRRDIDNFIKVAMDVLTGIVWVDDSQIKRLSAMKEVDVVSPRIEITIKN